MSASRIAFPAAVLLALCGVGWGIAMSISGDHSTMPAHAHLNLLGWVSLFLMGIYHHLHPALDATRIAAIQVWIWIAGTVSLSIGVGLIYSGAPEAEPLAAIGSLVLFADLLLFAALVLRGGRRTA